MTLQGLSIKKLFGQFDYDISLNNPDGITILTGPNGYGKTTILNIIHNLFTANFDYFQTLNFGSIVFILSDNQKIIVTKGKQESLTQRTVQTINGQQHITEQSIRFTNIHLNLEIENRKEAEYIYNSHERQKLLQGMINRFPFPEMAMNLLNFPVNTKIELNQDALQQGLQKQAFEILFPNQKFRSVFFTLNIYFIKEQRLMKQVTILGQNANPSKSEVSYVNTIQSFAKDLIQQISMTQTKAFQIGQQLDSTFPKRIMESQNKLSKEEFDIRIQSLAEKQKQLKYFGITLSASDIPQYDDSKADVLSVYLNDSEKKTAVFDELTAKINLFVTILGSKQLTKKIIRISGDSGFFVITNEGNKIDVSLLSSGEQQEIVLLYELLFKAEPNSLILIDEPEMSLHVTWQKEFVKDLLDISKIKNITFCLATHSPQIINGRWDLTTDLYTLENKMKNHDFEDDNAE